MVARTSGELAKRNLEPEQPPAQVRLVTVADEREGQRLDNYLAGQLKGVPKSLIYRILRTGQVRLNGKRAKPDSRVSGGDLVRIPPVRLGEPADHGAPTQAQTEAAEAAVIFEDRDFLVIDKPPGMASHGGSGVAFGAIELLRAARPNDTLELAHRLDRDTSGVLVLARKRAALTRLQALIRDNQTTKQYLALMMGHPHKAKFDVNVSLRKQVLQGGERMVRVDDDGKPALTRFHVADIYEAASLAEVTLFTGRTHQIRVHAQHIAHPLAGDDKYGERAFNQAMRAHGLKRLFLHAARFEFELGEKSYSFSTPLAPDLSAVLDVLPRGVSRKGKPR